MKKSIGFSYLAVLVMIIAFSCGPAEVKKEVIIVPVQKTQIITQPAQPEKKPTTITLDKNGVKVEVKKVDVIIKNN